MFYVITTLKWKLKMGNITSQGFYDAKNKEKLTYFYEMIRIGKWTSTIRNKLKHFLLEGSFES